MKQKQDSNTEQGNRANTLLYAVAPQPKLSTDAIALDGAVVSRGNGIGATSKPILFSTPMVHAILNGTKTQTRRIVKPEPHPYGTEIIDSGKPWFKGKGRWHNRFVVSENPTRYEIASLHDCPYGNVGDVLWVRETYTILEPEHCEGSMQTRFFFKAGQESNEEWRLECIEKGYSHYKWKPSIFMRKDACRIKLTITNIRVEPLNNISEHDALEEGITHHSMNDPKVEYQWLWEKINGRGSWALNPFVWVIEFSKNGI